MCLLELMSAIRVFVDDAHDILTRRHEKIHCFLIHLNGELISIIPSRKLQITDVLQCPTSHVPVTFSSRISFLLSALNKIRLEWSSTTSIFHLAGGWTDRMASRSSTTIIKKRSIFYWYSSTYFLLQSEWAKSWTMNECVEGQQLGSDRREVGGGSDEVI